MSGVLSDIRIIVKIIQTLKSRKDLVIGNEEKCKILIGRCDKFLAIVERMEKYKIVSPSQQECIRKLKDAMTAALALVETFCQPGWLRLVINVASARYYNEKFRDINSLLSDCSSDLQLDLGISSRIALEEEEAVLKDDHNLLMKIYEMLKVNNISMSTRVRNTLISPRSASHGSSNSFHSKDSLESIVTSIQQEVPILSSLSQDTEMFLENIYASETGNSEDLLQPNSSFDSTRDSGKMIPPFTKSKSLSSPTAIKSTIESVRINLSQLKDIRDQNVKWRPHHRDIIGRGSFGIVYKGIYDQQDVAIKVIQGYNSGIPTAEKRMIEREIYILAKCHHSNIIKFIGCDLDDGLLLTELALTNLFNVIYSLYDPMPHYSNPIHSDVIMKLEWLQDIANGLHYLHFYDIIHRDLKPRNILLSYSNQESRLVAKITDFGVSTVLGLSSAVQSITGGAVVGTTSYKAPELFNTKLVLRERYSKAVDIYAFGVLANELLSGELPWAGYPPDDVVIEVRDGKRPKLFKLLTSDPLERKKLKMVAEIIGTQTRGCFAKDRNRRPEASKISEDLELIIRGQIVHNPTNKLATTRSTTPSKFSSSLSWINSTIQAFRGGHRATDVLSTTADFDAKSVRSTGSNDSTPASSASPSPYRSPSATMLRQVQDQDRGVFFLAAKQGDVAAVAHILDSTDIDINITDKDGWTALIEAATLGRSRVVQLLIERGANIAIKTNYGYNALLQGCREGHVAVVSLLLDAGADIEGVGHSGVTPLLIAASNGRLSVVKLLLTRGANVNCKDKDWTTPLIAASRYGHTHVVHSLLQAKANLASFDKSSRTAYDWALRNKHEEIASMLKSVEISRLR